MTLIFFIGTHSPSYWCLQCNNALCGSFFIWESCSGVTNPHCASAYHSFFLSLYCEKKALENMSIYLARNWIMSSPCWETIIAHVYYAIRNKNGGRGRAISSQKPFETEETKKSFLIWLMWLGNLCSLKTVSYLSGAFKMSRPMVPLESTLDVCS